LGMDFSFDYNNTSCWVFYVSNNNNNNYNTCLFSRRFRIYSTQAADPNNYQSFVPKFISIPIQSIVTWTNDDSIQHTVTFDEEGLFDSGPLSPGDTIDNAFDTLGEFGYHCSIHPWMTGRVMVD
jgi:plastocyanin